MQERINELKEGGILLFSSIIFALGLFIQMASWWLKRFDQLKNNKNKPIQKQSTSDA